VPEILSIFLKSAYQNT